MNDTDSDYNLPFEKRYLACAEALERASYWLAIVGLGSNSNFKQVQSDFIRHGAETLRDIRNTGP